MIRRRLMLIAAPLCVVVVAASVAFASTTDTEHSGDWQRDDLHQVRPIAASSQLHIGPARAADDLLATLQREIDEAALRFTVLVQLEAGRATEAFAATLVAAAPSPAARTGYSAPGASGDPLACIRAHESDSAGGYQAVSSGGTYRGAYQFVQGTWDTTAGAAGRADLVGADPASVAPADQDAMASYLYAEAGSQPWGGRC